MPEHTQRDWYETPRYYDIVFRGGTSHEADFLEGALWKYGPRSGKRVLEPACGTGRLVAELARRGYRVLGFDQSLPMLSYARRHVRRVSAQFLRAQLEQFNVPGRFDLAHCLVGTFKYLLTEHDARLHLESVADALRPGGIYVLGLHLTDYASTSRTRERWVGLTVSAPNGV